MKISFKSRVPLAAALCAAMMATAACGASSEVRQAVAERSKSSLQGSGGWSDAYPADGQGTAQAGAGGAEFAAGPSPQGSASAALAPAASAVGGSNVGSGARTGTAGVRTGPSGPAPTGSATPGSSGPAAAGAAAPSINTAAGPLPGGNGGATDVGVTGETIKIGGIFLNGSWLDKYGQVAEQAGSAYFKYINDRGGIFGRKIEFVTCDTAATVNGMQGCVRKLAEQEKVFTLGPSLDFNVDTTVGYLAEKKLPWIGAPGFYDAEFTSPFVFPTQVHSSEIGALAATYAIQQLGAKRIGVSWNTQPPGPPCFDGVKRVATALGAQIVVDASNGPTESDLSPQVIRIRSGNPDAIILCNDPVNTVKFVQAAGRQNYKPAAGNIGAYCLADDVPQAMGPAGAGFYCLTSYDPYNANTPGVVEMNRIVKHYFPSSFAHAYTSAVFGGAKVLVDALVQAGPQLTRDRLIAALRAMTDYDTRMGLRLNFAAGARPKGTGVMMQADENLRWKQLGQRFPVAG